MSIHDRTKHFTVTADHVKLARRMYVGWSGDEFGAPEINPKRPYGNSDVVGDIIEILGLDGTDPKAEAAYARKLHEDMETALQVFLATGTFGTGDYDASKYGVDWRRVAS